MNSRGSNAKFPSGFSFDPKSKRWSLGFPSERCFGITGSDCSVCIGGRDYRLCQAETIDVVHRGDAGRRDKLTIRCNFGRAGFAWTITFEPSRERTAVTIRSEIVNRSSLPLTLDWCRMIHLDRKEGGDVNLGGISGQETFLCYQAAWRDHVRRIASDNGHHVSGPICHIHNPSTGATYFAGFVSLDRATPAHDVEWCERQGLTRHQATCRFHGHSMPPGARISSESLLVEIAEEPYGVLERWADTVKARYRPPIPAYSPVGWCGGWVDSITGRETPEHVVARNSAAIRKRLAGYGVKYIWISITNLKHGLPGNWLEFNRRLYPHGVEKTLAVLTKRGFSPGLWVGPFMMSKDADTFRANRNNLLMSKDGSPVVYCAWPWSIRRGARKSTVYRMDAGHPESLRFLKGVFSRYRELGVRYYMLDFLNAGLSDETHVQWDETIVPGYERFRRGMKAIKCAAGSGAHLLAAYGSGPQSVGLVNASRIGRDYGEGRHVSRDFHSYPATYIVNTGDVSDGCGPSHRNALQNLASVYFTHRRLWLNDLNLLTVDRPISASEARVSASLFGMSGSPVMLGDDIDTISEERLALIRKVLPRTPDTAFPVDLFKRVLPEDYSRVLLARVRKPWGEWSVVGVFNMDREPRAVEITTRELRLDDKLSYRLFDFWDERYCGTVKERLTIHVPPISCRILRMEAERKHPWILSTDMHVRQGRWNLKI